MKKLLLIIGFGVLTMPLTAQLSQAEKDFAINYLETTHANIVEAVKDLPEESFNYKPEDGGWSVSNALEHILLTETAFFGMAQGTLANDETMSEKDLSAQDGVLIGMLANRGTKVKTAPPFEPSGKWSSKAEMLSELEKSRTKLVEFLSSTDADLRGHVTALPFGDADVYQIMLLVAAHSQRHTFQMQEVLAEMNAM
ncbi:MAG: DinB family protein [Balneola sp.]